MKKKTKMGRPRLPKGLGKESVITVRLSKQERAKVVQAARAAGVKLSGWARMRLLSVPDNFTITSADGLGLES